MADIFILLRLVSVLWLPSRGKLLQEMLAPKTGCLAVPAQPYMSHFAMGLSTTGKRHHLLWSSLAENAIQSFQKALIKYGAWNEVCFFWFTLRISESPSFIFSPRVWRTRVFLNSQGTSQDLPYNHKTLSTNLNGKFLQKVQES